ncbi:MAG: threonylcarbamoyl-AMP synthase [Candidatus Magasanikbacteria bacterium]|nr:threonylcarbamoyl-AMP synthase [Candidatus Magasanikbacteria bacterium]
MEVLKECDLAKIAVSLFEGKTIVFPTETSYGLGCDATNQEAVDKIFSIKDRADDKPLLIVVPSVEMAKKYLVWNNTIEKLAKAYWPGALTIIGKYNAPPAPLYRGESTIPPKKEGGEVLASGVVSKNNTVAVRVSKHDLVKFLSESLGKPLVATSANISGAGEVYSGRAAKIMFAEKEYQPDIILDYGELEHRPPTTLVDASSDTINIIRQGQVEINI